MRSPALGRPARHGAPYDTRRRSYDPCRSDRVPYGDLIGYERDALHEWLAEHRIDPHVTPIDPLIEYDPAHQEWRIEQFVMRDGRLRLNAAGDSAATVVVRRARRSRLPWPTIGGLARRAPVAVITADEEGGTSRG